MFSVHADMVDARLWDAERMRRAGIDVVEVSPPYDHADITAALRQFDPADVRTAETTGDETPD